MPCYYTGSAEGDAQLARDEATAALTKVTKMLCSLCEDVEQQEEGEVHQSIDRVDGLREWWEKHKEIDRRRKEGERARQRKDNLKRNALSKLTQEEMKALGL